MKALLTYAERVPCRGTGFVFDVVESTQTVEGNIFVAIL